MSSDMLKTTINKCIAVNSPPLQYYWTTPNFAEFILDFLDDYPDTKEEMDLNFRKTFGPIIETTILVNTDHARDLKT